MEKICAKNSFLCEDEFEVEYVHIEDIPRNVLHIIEFPVQRTRTDLWTDKVVHGTAELFKNGA